MLVDSFVRLTENLKLYNYMKLKSIYTYIPIHTYIVKS